MRAGKRLANWSIATLGLVLMSMASAQASPIQTTVTFNTIGSVDSFGVTGTPVVSFQGASNGTMTTGSPFSLGHFQISAPPAGETSTYLNIPFQILFKVESLGRFGTVAKRDPGRPYRLSRRHGELDRRCHRERVEPEGLLQFAGLHSRELSPLSDHDRPVPDRRLHQLPERDQPGRQWPVDPGHDDHRAVGAGTGDALALRFHRRTLRPESAATKAGTAGRLVYPTQQREARVPGVLQGRAAPLPATCPMWIPTSAPTIRPGFIATSRVRLDSEEEPAARRRSWPRPRNPAARSGRRRGGR